MYGLAMFMAGGFSAVAILYALGKRRHRGHTGPSSKVGVGETVVPIVKKGF